MASEGEVLALRAREDRDGRLAGMVVPALRRVGLSLERVLPAIGFGVHGVERRGLTRKRDTRLRLAEHARTAWPWAAGVDTHYAKKKHLGAGAATVCRADDRDSEQGPVQYLVLEEPERLEVPNQSMGQEPPRANEDPAQSARHW